MKNIIDKIRANIMVALAVSGVNSAKVENDVYYMNDNERTSRVFYDRMRLCPFCLFHKNERVAVIFYLYDDGQAVTIVYDANGKRILEKEIPYFISVAQTKELAKWLIALENKKILYRSLNEYALYAAAYDAQQEQKKKNTFDKMVDNFFSDTDDLPDKKPGTNRAYYRIQRKKAIRKKCEIVRNVYNCVPYDDDPQSGVGFCKYAGQYGKGKIHDSRTKVRGRTVMSPAEIRKKQRDEAAYEDYMTGEYIFPVVI